MKSKALASLRVPIRARCKLHLRNSASSMQTQFYTTALTRGVASTLPDALSMSSPMEPISFSEAQLQHHTYINEMKGIMSLSTGTSTGENTAKKVIELDADDNYPDCVFIEDTAVVIDDKAVITKIGAESRRGEVDAVKKALVDLGLDVYDMRDASASATCDGGDVLYPVSYEYSHDEATATTTQRKKGGQHLFVGISSRTNYEGAEYLRQIFQNVQVIPVELDGGKDALHLKSAVTHIDDKTLLVPEGHLGDGLYETMKLDERGYTVIRLPEITGCNVVSVNQHVLVQPISCVKTRDILEMEVEKRMMKLKYIDASEFAKVDGALTCKSILIP